MKFLIELCYDKHPKFTSNDKIKQKKENGKSAHIARMVKQLNATRWLMIRVKPAKENNSKLSILAVFHFV